MNFTGYQSWGQSAPGSVTLPGLSVYYLTHMQLWAHATSAHEVFTHPKEESSESESPRSMLRKLTGPLLEAACSLVCSNILITIIITLSSSCELGTCKSCLSSYICQIKS